MKNYRTFKILLIVIVVYFILIIFKEYHPIFYGQIYNNQRVELGLKPIEENLKRKRDKTSRNQLWINENDTIPRFYSKYTSFNTWHGGIEMENDNYLVTIDSLKTIISINYNFNTKKYDYRLKEYVYDRQNVIGVYGYPSKTISEIEKDQVVELLNENGIKYWLQQ